MQLIMRGHNLQQMEPLRVVPVSQLGCNNSAVELLLAIESLSKS